MNGVFRYLNDKWLLQKDEKPLWTTFQTAKRDLAEIEADGLASGEMIARWRTFYSEQKEILENGQLFAAP